MADKNSKSDQLRAMREANSSRSGTPATRNSHHVGRRLSDTGGAVAARPEREAKRMSKKSPSKVVGKVDIKPKRGPGRPKIKEKRPWETEGISRRTWYRRQTGKAGK